MHAFFKLKENCLKFKRKCFKKKPKISTFEKRKKVYNSLYDYVQDCEYPSKVQQCFMVVGNLYWCHMMMALIFFVTMYQIHVEILAPSDISYLKEKDYRSIQILVGTIFMVDMLVSVLVQYVMKLQFVNASERPWWVFICECIAVFTPKKLFKYDYILYALLWVRLFYHLYKSRLSLNINLIARVFYFFISITVYATFISWMIFFFGNYEPGWETYVTLLEISSTQVIGKGSIVSFTNHYEEKVWERDIPIGLASILVMFVIIKPTVCDIILILTMQYEDKFKYIYKVYFFEFVMIKKYYCNQLMVKNLMAYLQNYWEERKGYIRRNDMDLLLANVFPSALLKEMTLDCAYDFFRHSQVLRNLEIPTMRYLAGHLEIKLFMRGEYVFTKRSMIKQVIFINSGCIDLLSSENGDSGILTLTTGTVLGEISLIYPYKAPVSLRCQSVCEVLILHRKDFIELTRYYPFAYFDLYRIIKDRFKFAKRMKDANLAKEEMSKKNIIPIDHKEGQLIWLKSTLHRLKAADPSITKLHKMKNIFLEPYLQRIVDKHDPKLHTMRYLEMLSIKVRNDVNMDLVFIRSQCIWILKYNSPIYKVWDILIAILAFIMLLLQPYEVFHEPNRVLHLIVVAMNLFFTVDVLLSLITPVSAKSKASTLPEIFAERVRTFGFYLDCFTIMQFQYFGHAFPFGDAQFVFIIHTVKLWKVYRLMNKWEQRFKLNLLVQKYCVFVISLFIYIYTLGYILQMVDVIQEPFDPVGVQISTGVGFKIRSVPLKPTILYTLINIFAVVFESLGTVSVTTANYMKYIQIRNIYHSFKRLHMLQKRNPQSHLFKRLNSFLNTQINDNQGFVCAFDIILFFDFPSHYMELLTSQIYATALKDLEFFKFIPRELVKRLSASTVAHTYHRHAVILSYGSIHERVYILTKGVARTLYGEKFYPTSLFTPLNILEMIYNLPSTATVVGLTEVEVVSFHYQTFLELLRQHPGQINALNNTIQHKYDESIQILNTILNGKQMVIRSLQSDDTDSFYSYELADIYEDSYEEYDYLIPFDRIAPFGFLRYILMTKTIMPLGWFMHCWEIGRCIFAYITAIVFFIPPLSLQSWNHPFTYILIFLDCTAIIDIYFRFHVSYYNEKGLLITHPLFTAKKYLFKSFTIDLIACAPIYLFVPESPQYRIIFNILHLLQLYRLIGFKMHYFYTTYIFDYGFVVATLVFPMNLAACLIYMIDCYSWNEDRSSEMSCKTFPKTEGIRNYLTICYFVMSTLTCSGTGSVVDLESVNSLILNIISVSSFVSVFVRIYVTAYLFGSYNKVYSGAYKLRSNVDRLVTFLRKENVQPYLRKQLKLYYELRWRWLHRINPLFLLRNLNPALRRDLTYCLYGEHIHTAILFEDNPNLMKNFIKNVLFNAKPLIIPKNGYILTINDVHSDVYFIYKGSVDVVAANGVVIETIYDGSIIGNLDTTPMCRQKVSFVTNSVTRLLYLSTTQFHTTLNNFPTIKESFVQVKYRKLYYIPSSYIENKYERAQWVFTPEQLKAGYHKYHLYEIYSWVHFIFACCIGLTMELYQIATGEVHFVFLITQYTFDFIHLTHQYMKFSVPYMNSKQEFVMHPLRIKAHTMGKKRKYYHLYFINLPIDLVLLAVLQITGDKLSDWSVVFSALRLNRLARWFCISRVYYNGLRKIASVLKSSKLTLLFLLLIYSTFTIATILAISDYCFIYYLDQNESHIIRELPIEHLKLLRSSSWRSKANMFGRYWYVSMMLHTFTHDNLYYPIGDFFEMLFIFIFLYVTVFESFILVHYYQVLMEPTTLLNAIFSMKKYIQMNLFMSRASFVLRKSVDEAITHYYNIKSISDDYLLHANSPKYLYEAAMGSIYGYLLEDHPYFSACHPDMVRQVMRYMRVVHYPINGVIVNRRDCVDKLFFVHQGEVAAVQFDNDCTSDAQLVFRKGDSFGFEQTLKQLPSQHTYRTVTFCEIVELSWSECKHLLDFFPMAKTHFVKTMNFGVKYHIKTAETLRLTRKKRI